MIQRLAVVVVVGCCCVGVVRGAQAFSAETAAVDASLPGTKESPSASSEVPSVAQPDVPSGVAEGGGVSPSEHQDNDTPAVKGSESASTASSARVEAAPTDIKEQGLEAELEKIRDPFKKPEIAQPKLASAAKEELEKFVIESYRLVGVITGPAQVRAMLIDSEGKTHFVAVGAKIGSSGGVVAAISADRVKIQEQKAMVEIRMP